MLFLTPSEIEAAVVQPVHMTEASGHSWLAIYTLMRQSNSRWLINGCVLVPDRSMGV